MFFLHWKKVCIYSMELLRSISNLYQNRYNVLAGIVVGDIKPITMGNGGVMIEQTVERIDNGSSISKHCKIF